MTVQRNCPILRPRARELRAWRPLLLAIHLALQTACTSVATDGAPLSGERLFERVERYADFGEHRTGGAADRATSRWLDDELSSFGFAVERQPFVVRQFFPEEQQLELEGRSLSVFPHWLPKASTAPIRAQLAPLGDDDLAGKIAFLAPEHAGEWFSLRPSALAEEAARKAAAIITLNAGATIYVSGVAATLADGVAMAEDALASAGQHAIADEREADRARVAGQGASHGGATFDALPEIVRFMDARAAGEPFNAPASCDPPAPVVCEGAE